MKAKLLLVLLIIGLHYTAFAQVAHDYKPNCCRLAGATFTTEKSCYCAGCAAVDKKNTEAKAAEDKRVQEVAAKKVEEKKQKAIAEAKKQKEELEKKANDSKANVVHLGFANTEKKAPQPEVKKEKITSDKRFQLQSNRRDNVAGFDDANGEPLLYSDNYTYTKTQDYLGRGTYPLGYGVAYFKDKSVDVIDYKGKQYLNDKDINDVFHVYDKWFLAVKDLKKESDYNRPYSFKSAYFINIANNEKVEVPFEAFFPRKSDSWASPSTTWFRAGFDALALNDLPKEKYGENPDANRDWKMRLLLSEFLEIDVKDWKAMIMFETRSSLDATYYYYIDSSNKLRKVGSTESFYDIRQKYQNKYGSLWW